MFNAELTLADNECDVTSSTRNLETIEYLKTRDVAFQLWDTQLMIST